MTVVPGVQTLRPAKVPCAFLAGQKFWTSLRGEVGSDEFKDRRGLTGNEIFDKTVS